CRSALAVHTVRVADAGHLLELRKQAVEVFQVPHFEVEDHLGETGGRAHHGKGVDVGVVGRDGLGDLGQRSGLVDGGRRYAGGEALLQALVNVPAHVDPAVRLVVEGRQRGRLDRVDGYAGARLENAD